MINGNGTPCVFIGTDAEKVYAGFGDTMLNWIQALYSAPSAQVRVSGVLSEPFMITNGMRQGCHLWPLLFALLLEPLLCTVHLNPNITGVAIGDTQHKVSAYVDDMLFSFTNPIISLPNLLQEFLKIRVPVKLENLFRQFRSDGNRYSAAPPHESPG